MGPVAQNPVSDLLTVLNRTPRGVFSASLTEKVLC
jgi:hypothetical protein